MSSLRRRAKLALVGGLFAFASTSRVARAQVTVQACSEAYTKGQEERLVARLFSARTQFRFCDDSACPEAIVADCKRWTSEVEAELPSISVQATNPSGDPIEGLSFTIDGTVIASDELARPVIVDVGPHVFRFEAAGYQPVQIEQSLELENRDLPISAVMQPVPPAPPAAPSAPPVELAVHAAAPPLTPLPVGKPFPVAAVTLASIGTLALGGSLYFGLAAQHQYHQLQGSCAPNCAEAQRESVANKALISDITLAASAVALSAAAWVYFHGAATAHTNAAVGLEPRPGGAALRLRLTF